MNEELKDLFESLGLSDDTVAKMKIILEAAIEAAKEEGKEEGKAEGKAEAEKESEEKTKETVDALEESHAAHVEFLMESANNYGAFLKEQANLYGETIQESVTTKMKEYAEFAIDQFITENKARFVETEQYERMSASFGAIHEAFERNGFTVREDAAVIELQESLQESTNQYESIFEELALAREEIEIANRKLHLHEATASLSDTQIEKVNSLLEAVTTDTFEEYTSSVKMIVEQVITAPKTIADPLPKTLNESVMQNKAVDNSIARFINSSLL